MLSHKCPVCGAIDECIHAAIESEEVDYHNCRHCGSTWKEVGEKKIILKDKEVLAKIPPLALVKIIDDSKIPLGEEEVHLFFIRGKVKRGEAVTKEEEAFLLGLVEKANEWQKGLTSSADTERTDTMSG